MPHTSVGLNASDRQERDRQIVKRMAEGEKLAVLAKDIGLSPERIRQICMEAGLRLKDLRKERNRQIVERVSTGESYTSVAQDFGLSPASVSDICQRMGLGTRDKYGRGRKGRDRKERDRKIVKRVAEGEKLAVLAKDIGLSPERIRQICMEAGLRLKDLRKERNRQIVERVSTGKSYTSVAQDFRLSRAHVSDICQRVGLGPRDKYGRDRKERNRRIVERVIAGETRIAVAKDLGLTPEQVSRICRGAGLRVKDRRLSDKDRQERDRQIVKRVAAGETRIAVAKDLGLSPEHIGLICRKVGLYFDNRGHSNPAESIGDTLDGR